MEGNDRPNFSKTQEGEELRNYIVLAFLNQKLQNLKYNLNTEKIFSAFIFVVCILVFALPFFKSKDYVNYVNVLMIVAGIVSITRYAYLYVWIVGWVWEKPFGKLFLAVSTPVIAATAKTISDQQIRQLIQTNPSQLPTAQQALFVYYGLVIIVVILATTFIVKSIASLFVEFSINWTKSLLRIFDLFGIEEFIGGKKPKFKLRRFTESISSMFAGTLLFLTLGITDSFFNVKDKYGNNLSLPEEIMLISSFVKNTEYTVVNKEEDSTLLKQSVKFCSNLDSDFYVSPVGNEVLPTHVLTARVRKNLSQKGRYEYQLWPCQNSNRLLSHPFDGRRGYYLLNYFKSLHHA